MTNVTAHEQVRGATTDNDPPSFHRSWMKPLEELLSSAVTLSFRGSMFFVSQLAAL